MSKRFGSQRVKERLGYNYISRKFLSQDFLKRTCSYTSKIKERLTGLELKGLLIFA